MSKQFAFVVVLFITILAATNLAAQTSGASPTYFLPLFKNEENDLKNLLNTSYNVLRSQAFQNNMSLLSNQYPKVARAAYGVSLNITVDYISIPDILAITEAKTPNRYVTAGTSLVGASLYRFALSGPIGDNTDNATLSLGRVNLTRWNSANVIEKSCAINTVAHEYSHLISNDPLIFTFNSQRFQDGNIATRSGQNAVASYLIGTVAQCTWLQQNNYSPKINLNDCINVFGHRGFNQDRCNQIGQGQEVKDRPGLAPRHNIID